MKGVLKKVVITLILIRMVIDMILNVMVVFGVGVMNEERMVGKVLKEGNVK